MTTLGTGVTFTAATGLSTPRGSHSTMPLVLSTALTPIPSTQRIVEYGDLDIVVVLGPDDRFLGISEVRVRRDFLTTQQRIAASGFHDVDHLYKE